MSGRRALSRAAVGLEVGPFPAVVDARWLMAYAAALAEPDARYFDTAAPQGPAAHPMFAVCYEWPAMVAIREKAIAPDVAPLGVHASHRVTIHRPARAGDELSTTARVVGVEPRPAGALLLVRITTADRAGERVTTTDYGSLFRGVEVDEASGSAAAAAAEAAPRRTGPPPAAADDVRWSEDVHVGAAAAHVYTECARIWNPIHTDIAAARTAGLPGLILHGTATLALAASRVIARDFGGDPTGPRSVAVRFTGMVPMPSTFTVRGRGRAGGVVAFDALDAAGRAVLAAGEMSA